MRARLPHVSGSGSCATSSSWCASGGARPVRQQRRTGGHRPRPRGGRLPAGRRWSSRGRYTLSRPCGQSWSGQSSRRPVHSHASPRRRGPSRDRVQGQPRSHACRRFFRTAAALLRNGGDGSNAACFHSAPAGSPARPLPLPGGLSCHAPDGRGAGEVMRTG